MRKRIPVIAAFALALGWMLGPPSGFTHGTTTNTVVFDREIVQILDKHCLACHAEGRLASSLTTYEDTWLRRGPILSAVLSRHMPPWAAVPGYGDFANENGLTLRETRFLISWVEGLGPRSGGEVFLNVREPVTEAVGQAVNASVGDDDADAWVLGEPNLVRTLDARVVEPEQSERIDRVLVDLELTEERQLRGLEFRPGDRRVVRAADFFLAGTGQWLGSWTPWYGFAALPPGVAHSLPAGANILADVYYRIADERVVDEGRLALFFSDDPVFSDEPGELLAPPADLVLEAMGQIPPFATMERFGTESTVAEEIRVLSLLPKFEPGIQSFEVSVRRPDGRTEILLFATDIPLEWPTPYILEEPALVQPGSVLRATAYYESESNMPEPGGFRLTVSRY